MRVPLTAWRLGVAAFFAVAGVVSAAAPVVSNVRAGQRAGTDFVDVTYDLAAEALPVSVGVQVSADGGATYAVPAVSFSGHVGANVPPGRGRRLVWNAGADWDGQFSPQVLFKLTATDSTAPSGMVLIPAGSFQMGDASNPFDGNTDERPQHTVNVSGFYMDRYEVTKQLWDDVRAWGASEGRGYTDLSVGQGKGLDHPVDQLSWYDVVKWSNARSERDGLVPVYYTNDAQTVVYKTGSVNVSNAQVKWSANGYRLPTEAEWEKAARGGLSGQRFPWGATIAHSQANYYSSTSYAYDVSPTRESHPTFETGSQPYTNPVGYFPPNGFGLYDMAGNAWEWCWDWKTAFYSSSPSADPQGPSQGASRVVRGGGWNSFASGVRVARRYGASPSLLTNLIGLRGVRR